MAQAKRSTAKKKSSAAGKSTAKKSTVKKTSAARSGRNTSAGSNGRRSAGTARKNTAAADTGLRMEIRIIAGVLLALILLLSCFDLAGSLGTSLRNIQFGLFGSAAYGFPLLFLYSWIYVCRHREEYGPAVWLKVLFLILVYVSLCGLFELFCGRGLEEDYTFRNFYMLGTDGFNGGAAGGCLVELFYGLIGMMGSYLLLAAILLVSLMLVTGRSLLRPIRQGGTRVVKSTRDGFNRMQEDLQERNLRREEIRQSKAEKAEERRRELEEHRQELENERLKRKAVGVDLRDTDLSGAADVEVQSVADMLPADVDLQSDAGRQLSVGDILEAEERARLAAEGPLIGDAPRKSSRNAVSAAAAQTAAQTAAAKTAAAQTAAKTAAQTEIPVQIAGMTQEPAADTPKKPNFDEIRIPTRAVTSGLQNQGARTDRKVSGVGNVTIPSIPAGGTSTEESGLPFMISKDRRTLSELENLDLKWKRTMETTSLFRDTDIPEEITGTIDGYTENMASGPEPEKVEDAVHSGSYADHSYDEYNEFSGDAYPDEEDIPWDDMDPAAALESITKPLRSAGTGEYFDDTAFKEGSAAGYGVADDASAADIRAGRTVGRAADTAGTAGRGGSAAGRSAGTPGSTAGKSAGKSADTAADTPFVANMAPQVRPYQLPELRLLKKPEKQNSMRPEQLRATAERLKQTLNEFGVCVEVSNISCGPTVTRYELHPQQGVKVSRIAALTDDIKLSLAAADIRIEAPIPGKSAVGIEVPNTENQTVFLREILDTDEFRKHPSKLAFGVGIDIGGKPVVADLARMPHVLIAGATGSGKSVCINTLIMSILYKATPDEVKFIMIDPKMVELSVYNNIPHLLTPVVTDPKKATAALNWAVAEMQNRYKQFTEYNVRDMKSFNKKLDELPEAERPAKMPQIVVIVDEMADLMMVAKGEVEEAICRLAQLARAAGIHLVLATQRPSVNVITGLIKANVPSRIAFAVTSGVDSRTIIDMVGAERLLGKGDMLFYPTGYPKPVRIQGAFVSDDEVSDVTEQIRSQDVAVETRALEGVINQYAKDEGSVGAGDRDELFEQCGRFIIENEKASIGNLQRKFRIGFNRAARIMDQLCDEGVVGPDLGTKARDILMTEEEFDAFLSGM